MSAQIAGGVSGAILEVDSTSKAARVTLYDSAGNEIAAPPTSSQMAQIDLRPGAITAGGTVALWAMRAGATKRLYIRRLLLQGSANPTTALASSWYYSLLRFSAAPATGGNAITIAKKRSSYGTSDVADIRQIASGASAGLGVTSIVFETPFSILTGPRNGGATVVLDLNFYMAGNERFNSFEIAPNEGLAIVLPTTNSILGDFLTGHVEWDER